MSRTNKDDRDFSLANKKPRRKKSFASKFFASFMLTAAVAAAVIAVASLLFLKEITESLPTTPEILAHEPSLATKVYDRKGRLITQLFQENRTWVKLQNVSPWMVKAILAAEDDKFYEHGGIRPVSIARAFMVDVFHGEAKQGASTIGRIPRRGEAGREHNNAAACAQPLPFQRKNDNPQGARNSSGDTAGTHLH